MISTQPPSRTLTRSTSERLLAGVCGGLAEHLRVPVMSVRIVMLALVLAGGAGVLLYLWLWGTVPLDTAAGGVAPLRSALTKPAQPVSVPTQPPATSNARENAAAVARVLPQQPARPVSPAPVPPPASALAAGQQAPHTEVPAVDARAARISRWPVAELLFGACLLLVGVLFVVQRFGVELRLSIILPGLAVLVGVGLTWWQIADRNRPDANQVPRVLGALALVAVGVLMFFVTAENPSVWTVIAAALAALAGVALAIAPWLLRLNRELVAERAGRAREAERSEIAAHLHDSVLQTLALIQQRSEPGSEVARIARGQERELREWLFRAADGGSAAPRETALEELRAHAAALEDTHAVRFETVGVGAEVAVPEPIVAAAKEAMLNAAQHAGGEVTVFAEVTPVRVSIDITDRGPGLDPGNLPEGRMGVRDSILGRMSHAGGTAKIVPGPGGSGTSVRLEMPRELKMNPAGDAETGATS
ncbi:ATP-binding protein [Leucobacter sp. G161]|uniref:ATP-binding protein n=1 Tax=Leucobacter sp. G161 TaxID=663704 RepID=UPI00073C3FF1|nr:ATP-binding protein [Leucobacter sp. G161]KUF06252.1 hypothetical protein AUL38_13695 [Leucobacter sp. G161]